MTMARSCLILVATVLIGGCYGFPAYQPSGYIPVYTHGYITPGRSWNGYLRDLRESEQQRSIQSLEWDAGVKGWDQPVLVP